MTDEHTFGEQGWKQGLEDLQLGAHHPCSLRGMGLLWGHGGRRAPGPAPGGAGSPPGDPGDPEG